MLEEFLVIFACINSTGCQETSTRYFEVHPEVKALVKEHERKVTQIIGPKFLQTVGPVLYTAAGGTGTVRLSKHFSLQLNKEKGTLTYAIGF